MQQTIKIQIFSKIFEILAKKKQLLKFVFCPFHISVAIHGRIAGFFCSFSQDVFYCAMLELFSQNVKISVVSEHIFAILMSKIVLFLQVET